MRALTPEQKEQEKARVRMHLRTAFLTSEAGRFAGRWLLNHLKLLAKLAPGEEDRALHNAAVDFMAAGEFNVTDFLEGAPNDA